MLKGRKGELMNLTKFFAAGLPLLLLLTACSAAPTDFSPTQPPPNEHEIVADAVEIALADNEIKVDGVPAGTHTESPVYIGNDILYYESGKDFTYGEGSEADAHSPEEAAEHTVVHITRPGTYSISGTLAKGQIAVDLGDQAKDDPSAVVTLILNGADITCEVAPAILFYNVYECGSADADRAGKDVDTSSAGANVILADGTTNTIRGSYVARIYKPDSVVLNAAGTAVEDAKKLHKYDAAFYSKMSMNINGGSENSGVLIIHAENEGLDSELHLTINGGIIHIRSGNDGINTNEDGVSVTTINGGTLNIQVTGETGEGDGIDSNGWLVINGGTVIAQACAFSADAGIDSDMGIHINGGTVVASGNMLDRISESNQTYAVLNFKNFCGAGRYRIEKADHTVVLAQELENSFTSLIISSADLAAGDYTLWYNDSQLMGASAENGGMFGDRGPDRGQPPEGMAPPELPEGFAPEKMEPGMEGTPPPGGFNGGSMGFGGGGPGGNFAPNMPNEAIALSEIFTLKTGANYFRSIAIKE